MQNEARSQDLPFFILWQTAKRHSWLALVSHSCTWNSRSVEKVNQAESDTSEENTEPLAASCCNL